MLHVVILFFRCNMLWRWYKFDLHGLNLLHIALFFIWCDTLRRLFLFDAHGLELLLFTLFLILCNSLGQFWFQIGVDGQTRLLFCNLWLFLWFFWGLNRRFPRRWWWLSTFHAWLSLYWCHDLACLLLRHLRVNIRRISFRYHLGVDLRTIWLHTLDKLMYPVVLGFDLLALSRDFFGKRLDFIACGLKCLILMLYALFSLVARVLYETFKFCVCNFLLLFKLIFKFLDLLRNLLGDRGYLCLNLS